MDTPEIVDAEKARLEAERAGTDPETPRAAALRERAAELQEVAEMAETRAYTAKERAAALQEIVDAEKLRLDAAKARLDAAKVRADAQQETVDAEKSKEIPEDGEGGITGAFSSHNYAAMVSMIEEMDSAARRECLPIIQSMLEDVRDKGSIETFRNTLAAIVMEVSMSMVRAEFQEIFNSLALPEGIDPSIVDMSYMAGVPQATDTVFGYGTSSSGEDEGMPDLDGHAGDIGS